MLRLFQLFYAVDTYASVHRCTTSQFKGKERERERERNEVVEGVMHPMTVCNVYVLILRTLFAHLMCVPKCSIKFCWFD